MNLCPLCNNPLEPVTEAGRIIAHACQESACGWSEWTDANEQAPTLFATCARCGCPRITCEETTPVSGPRLVWPLADRLYCNGCNQDKARTEATPRAELLANHRRLADKHCGSTLDCDCLQGVLL